MRVTTFSNLKDSGVTISTIAIAVTWTLSCSSISVTLFENHYNKNNIAKAVYPKCFARNVAEYAYFAGITRQGCFQKSEWDDTSVRIEDHQLLMLLEDSLYYLPQYKKPKEVFDYNFYCDVLPLLDQFECSQKIALIDTHFTDYITGKQILENSELVIVILRQDKDVIRDFFDCYSSIVSKAFFVIADYYPTRNCKLKDIIREFGFQRDRIGVIPHSDEFEWAYENGRIIEFLSSNFYGRDSDSYFIQELKKTGRMILQKVYFDRENKLGEVSG